MPDFDPSDTADAPNPMSLLDPMDPMYVEPEPPRRPKYECRGAKCGYAADEKWRGACPKCHHFFDCVKRGRDAQDIQSKSLSAMALKPVKRVPTGTPEFDLVLGGGGLVRSSAVFISGEAGSGKSTLLMQTITHVCKLTGRKAIYASGEQNDNDIGLIAQRVGALSDYVVALGNEGDIYKIIGIAEDIKPIMVVIDSIQTASVSDVEGDVGSARQLQAIADYVVSFAKQTDVIVLLVGHENKDGDVAGPEKVKHLVDTMIRIGKIPPIGPDGEPDDKLKGLRTISCGKNRYGQEELEAVLEMLADGSGLRTPSRKKMRRLTGGSSRVVSTEGDDEE